MDEWLKGYIGTKHDSVQTTSTNTTPVVDKQFYEDLLRKIEEYRQANLVSPGQYGVIPGVYQPVQAAKPRPNIRVGDEYLTAEDIASLHRLAKAIDMLPDDNELKRCLIAVMAAERIAG